MKKFLALIVSIFSLSATAADLYMPIPFSATGTIGPTVPILVNELKLRGWNVDYKLIGSCGPVKETLLNNKKPVATIWGTNWQRDSNSTCYLDIKPNDFAGILFYNSSFICGPRGQLNFKFTPGKTYTIAVNTFSTRDNIDMLHQLAAKLKVNFKIVTYKNSGAINAAFKSNETDLIFVNSGVGIGLEKNGETKCMYTDTREDFKHIKSISDVLGNNFIGELWVSFFVTSKGDLTEEQYSKLRNDLRDIAKSSKELNDYINGRNLFKYEPKLGDEFKFMKQGIKN
jgi:hypothetical protein